MVWHSPLLLLPQLLLRLVEVASVGAIATTQIIQSPFENPITFRFEMIQVFLQLSVIAPCLVTFHSILSLPLSPTIDCLDLIMFSFGIVQKLQSSRDFNNGEAGEFQYDYTNPMRFMFGISYIFQEVEDVKQQRGFISADVEFLNYLKVSDNELALLVNFNSVSLEYKRIVRTKK